MTETEAWNLAGDLLLDSPMEGTAWRLAREALAYRVLEDYPAVLREERAWAAGGKGPPCRNPPHLSDVIKTKGGPGS